MLKLTYTESDFYIKRLAQSPKQLVALRVMLAMGVGKKIVVFHVNAKFSDVKKSRNQNPIEN